MTYELSSTRTIYYRQVYGLLGWLSEIGGLFGAVSAISYMLVAVLQYRGVYMFLMSELYYAPSKILESPKGQ